MYDSDEIMALVGLSIFGLIIIGILVAIFGLWAIVGFALLILIITIIVKIANSPY